MVLLVSKLRRFLLFSLVLFSIGLRAQDKRFLSVSVTPGFLLAHRADIKNLASHNTGVEVSFEQEQNKSYWGGHYSEPTIGFGLLYYNLGKESTGNAIGGTAHIKLQVADFSGLQLNFRMAGGLAYLSKKFDLQDNRRNQAVGSHINGSMQFGLVLRKRFETSYIELGPSISHYSNAAFKLPNLGYNIPSFTFRFGKELGLVKYGTQKAVANVDLLSWRATAIYGKKQLNISDPLDFTNFGLQIRGLYQVKSVRSWRFGLDYTRDKTYGFSENPQQDLESLSVGETSEVAVAGGFQWSFGKTDVVAELGAYVYRPYTSKSPISQRMGIVYRFTDHLSGQGTLKFHNGVADFFEWGVGYTL